MADEISFEDFLKGPDPEVEASIKARRLNTRDANLARTVAGSPQRQLADEADDQYLPIIDELEGDIARTKDPKRRAILVTEHKRIKGEIGKRFAAEDAKAPFPLSLIPSAQAAGKAPDEPKEMSFDAFLGGSNAEFTEPSGKVAAGVAFDTTLRALKATGGEAAALADMVLSMPGFLLNVGGQIGGTIQAKARGVPFSADPNMLNPVTAYGVGREAGHTFSAPFMNPLKRAMDMFQSGEAYEHAKTTKGMEKFSSILEEAGTWVEKASGGQVSRDAVPMLAETLMAGATGVGSGKAKGIPAENMKLMRDQITKIRDEARVASEREAAANEVTPEEFVARVPVQQQIHELLGIRTPAEQAKITRERRKDAQSAFTDRPAELTPEQKAELEMRGTRTYDSTAESQFRATERMGQSEILEVLQKEPTERSPVDIAMLRMGQEAAQAQRAKGRVAADAGERVSMEEAMEIAQKPQEARTNVENTKFRQWAGQKGNVSADALGLLAAAGIGATAGSLLDDNALRGAVLGGVAGLGPAMLMRGPGKVESRFGQAGAVKGPGGMWHPEAVERLTLPLAQSLLRDRTRVGAEVGGAPPPAGTEARKVFDENKPINNWSEKAIRNYLNRYAGTEKDPLKDVNVPSAQGEIPWSEAMDSAIKKGTVREMTDLPDFDILSDKGLLDTPAFTVNTRASQHANAVPSYLSHVGDFLRQNVPAEKLQQYDLVRAVKETAANDARVAKQMEKAAGDSTKQLPVYKEYPDGFKWVELKLPEKLTEEQAKRVRARKDSDVKDPRGERVDEHVAIGPDGRPIENSYTGSVASGKTPEQAYLAGRLAEEGNQMGHCVGGYCEGVAAGDTQIYSLRDPKGKSHVTIEVEPEQNSVGFSHNEQTNIQQIKGKQNRAPSAEYLPYVQDFVKGGKWGEVGDIQNAGMTELSKTLQERHKLGRYVTQAEIDANPVLENLYAERNSGRSGLGEDNRLLRERPRREEGKISQEMVVGLSAIGLGGVIGSLAADDSGQGALLGALAGGALMLPGVKARLADAVKAVDWGLGSLSTRIGNISEAVKLRGRDYERRVLEQAHVHLDKVVPFFKELNKLGKTERAELDRAILTNDKDAIAGLIKGNQPMVAAWRQVQNVLNDLGGQLQGHGRFKTMLDDYFPRLVKDVDGLKEALGAPERTRLEQALLDAEAAVMKNRGTPLTAVEQSSIINREIQGFRRAKGYQPGFAKGRKVDEITERLQPFYHTPEQSLYAYVRGAVQDLELARFFGKDLAQTKIAGQNHINVETSVGNLVGRELAEKKITPLQAKELINMLQARFQGGERASSRLVQEVRNMGNLGLLGNVVSAVTQLGDTATAIYAQGMRPAITALLRQATGKEKITTKDFGLADHIAEEFVSPTKTANWLNQAFKWSGFSAIDRFGKNTNLNAALDKAQRQSRTSEGVNQLATKYGNAFGKEFPQLVSDLKAGRITERVRSLLFSELSDVQPISKLEMPQGYLENPNGRLVYMLKTFMLKQADMMRRDVYNEVRAGHVGKAARNATGYALVLGLAGATTDMIKDWLLGRDPHFDAGDTMENVLKTFGMGEYTRDKIARGKPVEATIGAFVPPYKMMDDIIRRDPKAVQYIPIIGKLYYSWELGGKEASEISRKKKTGEELSEEAKEYRRQRREAAREKRENQ